jgi:hypothetical protein
VQRPVKALAISTVVRIAITPGSSRAHSVLIHASIVAPWLAGSSPAALRSWRDEVGRKAMDLPCFPSVMGVTSKGVG